MTGSIPSSPEFQPQVGGLEAPETVDRELSVSDQQTAKNLESNEGARPKGSESFLKAHGGTIAKVAIGVLAVGAIVAGGALMFTPAGPAAVGLLAAGCFVLGMVMGNMSGDVGDVGAAPQPEPEDGAAGVDKPHSATVKREEVEERDYETRLGDAYATFDRCDQAVQRASDESQANLPVPDAPDQEQNQALLDKHATLKNIQDGLADLKKELEAEGIDQDAKKAVLTKIEAKAKELDNLAPPEGSPGFDPNILPDVDALSRDNT